MYHIQLLRILFPPIALIIGVLVGAATTQQDHPRQTIQLVQGVAAAEPSIAHPAQEAKQEFEPVFKDWDKPEIALFFSGRQDGYIEPCGCTGLANQLGGMMRRDTLLRQLRDKGWDVIAVDAGNQVKRFGRQANLKLVTSYECLAQDLKYEVVGFGPKDLKLPTIELMQAMANSGLPSEKFVSANVSVFDESFSSRYRVVQQGGKRIGVTTLLGDEHLQELAGMSDVTLQTAKAALPPVIVKLREEKCDLNVLVVNASLEATRQLAKAYPTFDLVVCAGVDGEPTAEPEVITHRDREKITQLIQTGNKGMYVGVIGVFTVEGTPLMKYQRVPLDARYPDSQAIKTRFLSYQKQMEALGLEGLEVKPVAHPSGRQYVGSEACYDCHESAYDIWKDGIDGNGGPHFRATADLTDPGERTWVKRHHDPECISCHVTGWNAQGYFPYETGFANLDDKLLHGNGCENCHGPASRHVAAENGDLDVTEEQRMKYVQEMVVTLQQAKDQMCQTCHDLDNSPDFHEEGAFEKYWDQIKHYEDN